MMMRMMMAAIARTPTPTHHRCKLCLLVLLLLCLPLPSCGRPVVSFHSKQPEVPPPVKTFKQGDIDWGNTSSSATSTRPPPVLHGKALRDQYAAQEPLRREKEKEALRNATTNETVPLIEHALDQFKTVPFADERDAHHEDAKWQSKGKSDDLCGYSENGPETLKRTAQNLRQSYGCLKPFKGAVDDLGAAKALMEARAFQDDVIVLLAHWKDDFDDTPPPRFVVEDFLAMLENLRMLHFDHYVVSVVNEKACARLEEAIKEISLDLLPPGSVLSCAYMPNDSALPLTDMATPSVHVCEIASVQPLCAKAKRYMDKKPKGSLPSQQKLQGAHRPRSEDTLLENALDNVPFF